MQLALVNLWVGPGVGSFPGSDAQKTEQVLSAWEQDCESMCPAQR